MFCKPDTFLYVASNDKAASRQQLQLFLQFQILKYFWVIKQTGL